MRRRGTRAQRVDDSSRRAGWLGGGRFRSLRGVADESCPLSGGPSYGKARESRFRSEGRIEIKLEGRRALMGVLKLWKTRAGRFLRFVRCVYVEER